jgi:hypothetical protein
MSASSSRAVADARAHVDFFVNSCFLSFIVALLAAFQVFAGAADFLRARATSAAIDPSYFLIFAAACVVSWLAYESAVRMAVAWGDLVKSMFDVYLPALAKQLGYKLPETQEKRLEFWDQVNSMFLYREAVKPEDWPLSDKAPAIRGRGDYPDEAEDS